MSKLSLLVVSLSLVLMVGCSKPEEPEENFLQDQVNAMDKAKEVEGVLQDSFEQRAKQQE